MHDRELDVTGTCCPLPLIHLAEAIGEMQPQQVLRITGDDPIFESGVRDFCHAKGHEIVDVARGRAGIAIRIRVTS